MEAISSYSDRLPGYGVLRLFGRTSTANSGVTYYKQFISGYVCRMPTAGHR